MQPKVKLLEPRDWKTFKSIRLNALRNSPASFSPSTDEFKRSDAEWKQMLLGNSPFTGFILEWPRPKKVIGLTGMITDKNDPTGNTALFVMSYILADYRGRGYSGLLYSARIEWAQKFTKYSRLIVGHREGNEASKKANQRYGFQLYEVVDHMWPDGKIEKLYNYELIL